MNHCEGPSNAELEKRLEKRLRLAEFPKYDKRFNRNGIDRTSASSDGSPNAGDATILLSHPHGDGVENSNTLVEG